MPAFDDDAGAVLVQAQQIARDGAHAAIDAAHLLLALLTLHDIMLDDALRRTGVEVDTLEAAVTSALANSSAGKQERGFTSASKAALDRAPREAQFLGDEHIGVEHLLLALTDQQTGITGDIMRSQKLTSPALRTAIVNARRVS